MALRGLLGRGTVEDVQAAIAVPPLVPATTPLRRRLRAPVVRTVASFGFRHGDPGLAQLASGWRRTGAGRPPDLRAAFDLTLSGAQLRRPPRPA
jgi:hypothetical protein